MHAPNAFGEEVVGAPEASGPDILHTAHISGPFFIHYLYIIYSRKLDRYYVGHTEDVTQRLEQHLAGISSFTAKAKDWVVVYTEEFPTREQARQREKEIKKKKSRTYIEWLVNGQ